MVRINVEKYVDGQRETGFSVPMGIVRLAANILPQAAKRSLSDNGIYLDEMARTHADEMPFARWIEVSERGVRKSIKFTLEK